LYPSLSSNIADGYLAPLLPDSPPSDTIGAPSSTEDLAPLQTPTKVMKKIPRRIIQNAAGIAVFTCMRSGLWMTGSGGSGILIARKADGTWSPPSGILLHTPTLSFIIGVDIYDCVLVINSLSALEALTRPRVTLGEDVTLTRGPLVTMDSAEIDVRWRELGNTVLTYLKSRGQAQNVNLNGCILTERSNENERFYSNDVSVMEVLAGNVSKNVEETRPLFEVIKAAEGRTDYDRAVLEKVAQQPAPGDAILESPATSPASPRSAFGIPQNDDPDPFGVLALEMAGLEIREAGTRLRPASHQFDYTPSPTSPVFPRFNHNSIIGSHRQSVDTYQSRSNRGSLMSTQTTRTQMTDAFTQTDVGNTPETSPSPRQSEDGRFQSSLDGRAGTSVILTKEPEEIDYTKIDLTPLRNISGTHSIADTALTTESVATSEDLMHTDKSTMADDAATKASSICSDYGNSKRDHDDLEDINIDKIVAVDDVVENGDDDTIAIPADVEGDADDEDEDEDDEDEPVIFEVVAAVQPARAAVVASAQAIQAKGALVTIPKRVPPPLPLKSPARASRSSKSDIGDVSGLRSPHRQSLAESVDTEDLATIQTIDPKQLELDLPPLSSVAEVESSVTPIQEDKKEEIQAEEAETIPAKADEPEKQAIILAEIVSAAPFTEKAIEPTELPKMEAPQVSPPAITVV
jgi:lipid-binding SYLF domain-containing protein